MEKRWSERRQLCVGVDVYRDGDLLNSARSSDIGLGGLFLNIESPAGLQKDSCVDLVFHLQKGTGVDEVIRHQMSARVARVAESGVGLKFCDFDTGVFRALQEIMLYQTPQGDASRSASM